MNLNLTLKKSDVAQKSVCVYGYDALKWCLNSFVPDIFIYAVVTHTHSLVFSYRLLTI